MIYFDTSVLVTAMVDQLPNHDQALACLAAACRETDAATSTHALAESYSTLSALPLPRRILPGEVLRMISEGLEKRLTILTLDRSIYQQAMERTAARGLASGAIYDALHLVCAESAGCLQLQTYNLGHFQRLGPKGLSVVAP